jgi:hypothetical protein
MWAARFTPQQAAKALAAQTSSQFVPRFDPKVPPSAVLKKLLRSCCPFSLQNEAPSTPAEAGTPDNSSRRRLMWAARFTPQQAAKALAAQTSSQFVPRLDPKYCSVPF